MAGMKQEDGVKRHALRVDPLRTCPPVGGMYAALGVHACMPHSHGSPGCCRYQRLLLTQCFRQPVRATTSVLKENAAIFGGGPYLREAVDNIFERYRPEMVAVLTTCMSETIGDDMAALLREIRAGLPRDKYVVFASTPGYSGSHVDGYAAMVRAVLEGVSTAEGQAETALILPGFVGPGNMRELRRIVRLFTERFVLFPDTSNVLDLPYPRQSDQYPKGGARIADLAGAGGCGGVFALGETASGPAAQWMTQRYGMPAELLRLPVGPAATDRFLLKFSAFCRAGVPEELLDEREQLLEAVRETHAEFYGKKAAIVADPDLALALTEFLAGMGMVPLYVYTGVFAPSFKRQVQELLTLHGVHGEARDGADLYDLRRHIREEPVDLIVGGTHAGKLARAVGIPYLPLGFPVTDRALQAFFPIVGYRGGLRILEQMQTLLAGWKDTK